MQVASLKTMFAIKGVLTSDKHKWIINRHVQSSVHQLVEDFSGHYLPKKSALSKSLILVERRGQGWFRGTDIVEKCLVRVCIAFQYGGYDIYCVM